MWNFNFDPLFLNIGFLLKFSIVNFDLILKGRFWLKIYNNKFSLSIKENFLVLTNSREESILSKNWEENIHSKIDKIWPNWLTLPPTGQQKLPVIRNLFYQNKKKIDFHLSIKIQLGWEINVIRHRIKSILILKSSNITVKFQ